ncbi:hypothetical protein [Arthrobacter sp. MYb213]|uniref:hypothetical protein n=1 Tax=Arthrobacter sp. MYb213 TaxID=1848595 RepID=UPI000CFCCD39|nr:hypothetical protein [Arthrobacter sp. MYb213]PRB68181.1 hypothetical protein CQ011_14980 [Arthrobacter sp. MYb213]
MKQRPYRLRLLCFTAASALLFSGCSTADPAPDSGGSEPAQSPQASASSPAPSTDASATASTTEPSASAQPSKDMAAELTVSKEVMGIGFKLPEDWSVAGDDCQGECTEYDNWEVKDRRGEHVLTLIPNTATSPDGDPNLYEREVLKQVPVPGLKTPTSLLAEFWTGTSQEDGKQETGFSLALIDDQVLADRSEMPDLEYFKIGDSQAPMFWVDDEYMEDQGIGDDPTRAGVDKFLASEQYQTVEAILLSVRQTDG